MNRLLLNSIEKRRICLPLESTLVQTPLYQITEQIFLKSRVGCMFYVKFTAKQQQQNPVTYYTQSTMLRVDVDTKTRKDSYSLDMQE